ncbi:MFS transporter [Paenibacillus thiaminolyticus]|nr:MFS transporter [Paenibacillus thiaminolyticus]MCY9537361.1 MFS transporter [Paenibacillus thiaminolyticus]MCY9613287.1 MFS transporter [Paenibacillus thiaminolyticus]MCY9617702.1 MFS transporter [Paenibacillus thiaminolyticus]MCY9635617.1 MFS transporter [Paenibacillus thiaminolyticus]MCY9642529.1 MFS transporter [Paenibacillus thiaminolyticus]
MSNQVSWKERISYGLGDTASNLIFQMITMYFMLYYTDVYGLNVAAVGTLFLVARIIDAFDSPIFGVLIDRTNTRWGKSRPYFLWLALPFAIVAVLTFMTPDIGDTDKIVCAYITYIALGIFVCGNQSAADLALAEHDEQFAGTYGCQFRADDSRPIGRDHCKHRHAAVSSRIR